MPQSMAALRSWRHTEHSDAQQIAGAEQADGSGGTYPRRLWRRAAIGRQGFQRGRHRKEAQQAAQRVKHLRKRGAISDKVAEKHGYG